MCQKLDDYLKDDSLHRLWAEDLSVTISREGIGFDDEWNTYPYLPFHYCPFCGEKLDTESKE